MLKLLKKIGHRWYGNESGDVICCDDDADEPTLTNANRWCVLDKTEPCCLGHGGCLMAPIIENGQKHVTVISPAELIYLMYDHGMLLKIYNRKLQLASYEQECK